MKRLICFFACLAVILAVSSPVWAQDSEPDKVERKDGKVLEGVISDVTYEGVTMKLSGGPSITTPWDQIAPGATGVIFSGKPGDLTQAEVEFRNGNFAGALSFFQNVVKNAQADKMPKYFLQYGLIGEARSHSNMGSIDAAVASYDKLLSVPKTKFIREGYFECIEIMLKEGAKSAAWVERATTMIANGNAAAGKIVTKGMKEEMNDKFVFYEAKALEASGSYDKSQDKYREAIRSAKLRGDLKTKAEATLGIARCLIKQKDVGAEDFLTTFLDDKDVPPAEEYPMLMAEVWNLIGDITYAKVNEEKDLKRKQELLKNALEYYLHGAVQFMPTENDFMDEKAKALYMSSECYLSLSDMVKDTSKELSDTYKNRTVELSRKVKNEFPIPVWVKKAEAILTKLGTK